MKKFILLVVLVFALCTQSFAGTSVWKAQKGTSVMYLGGTCHLLRPADFPLPPEFERAYRAADALVFETDLGKLHDPAVQQRFVSEGMYPNGTTIQGYLTPATYKKLEQYCLSKGLPLERLKQFKPFLISITLTMIELKAIGIAPEGVDMYMYRKGVQDGKPVEKLETVEQQMGFIASMGEGYEESFINYSLNDLQGTQSGFVQMLSAWRQGDDKLLDRLFVGQAKSRMPLVYYKLIADRNNNWLPMIDKFGKSARKEFILVGVAHLVGPDGILEALKQKGYRVEKL